MTKEYGFIKPTITREHYIFGASPVPFVVRKEDGNWFNSLPVKELQNTNFEKYNCTSYKTLDQIETYMLKVFGEKVNYSDRWLGIIAGTKPPGNDPQVVYEAIRKYGLIPEEMLPADANLANIGEYYSFKGADKEACYREGRKWLEKWDFYHEWVFGDGYTWEERIHNMKLAIKTSPLAVAVYAWAIDDRGVYVKMADENHWTTIYSIEEFQKVFDSYEPVLKDVDQEINFCKRIYMERKPLVELSTVKLNLWQRIIKWINEKFS